MKDKFYDFMGKASSKITSFKEGLIDLTWGLHGKAAPLEEILSPIVLASGASIAFIGAMAGNPDIYTTGLALYESGTCIQRQ